MSLIKTFKKRWWMHTHTPEEYARRIGVNAGEDFHVYGDVVWSTEPWIITVGDHVHITDGVRFETHDGGTLLFRREIPDLEVTRPIVLGDNVYVGNCAIIMGGVTIGSNVVIGAGAIVTRDIPSNSVAVGVPAKVIETTDAYLEKLKARSLHLGHLTWEEKDLALKSYYGYAGTSRGIYEFR